MYRIIWQYSVRPEGVDQFKKVYAADGVWTEFFRRSPDYVTTELYGDLNSPLRFITVDVWRNRGAYENFRKSNATDYVALDEACTVLVAHERTLGVTEDGKE